MAQAFNFKDKQQQLPPREAAAVVIYGEKRYNINNAIKAYYDGIFDVFEYFFLEERWTYAI